MSLRFGNTFLFRITFVWATLSGQTVSDLRVVNEPRPMMTMADQLQQRFGIAINYEDPRYEYKDDVSDVTATVLNAAQRQANPNARILIPRGGTVSVAAAGVRPGQPMDAAVVLESAKAEHEAASLPGRFTITQTPLAVFVEPRQIRTSSSNWANVTPMLSTRIRFPRLRRTAADTLSLIVAEAAKGAGTKVELVSAPIGVFAAIEVELGNEDQPARAALIALFERVSARLVPDGRERTLFSYRMLFDPGLRHYVLSIATVPNREPVQKTVPGGRAGDAL
ncbi:MAG: hypothetical protein IT168_00795 [Bryobacterales bacterium]|nr:hypothetical protein [Bryobacterales bacterium]